MRKLFKVFLCLLVVSVCVVAPISAECYSSEYEYWDGFNAGYDIGYPDGFADLSYSSPEILLDHSDIYNKGLLTGYSAGYADGVFDRIFPPKPDKEHWSAYLAGWDAGYDIGYPDGLADLPYSSPEILQGHSDSYNKGLLIGYSRGYDEGVFERVMSL